MVRRNKIRMAALGTTALATMVCVGSAMAQQVAATSGSVETVVVTGTHLHGVAPVGSSVVTVSTADMEKEGRATFIDMLRDLPQVDNIGFDNANTGRNLEGQAGNQNAANSINLRGVGSEDTLTLVNGMRMVSQGVGLVFDPGVVPQMLVQRIDVIADGGSAVYGTDAVVGTVNLVYKNPVDIFEMRANVSHDKGQLNYQGDIVIGHTWTAPGLGAGGLLWSLDYQHQDPLLGIDRPGTYFDDLTPYLGAAAPPLSLNALPGNVTIAGKVYSIPTGVAANQGVTLAQLGTGPRYTSQINARQPYELPPNNKYTTGFVFKQDITPWLHFSSNGLLEWRRAISTFGGQGSQGTSMSVPNTNPYSPCATAAAALSVGRATPPLSANGISCPANGTITVQTSLITEMGLNTRVGTDKTFMIVGELEFDLPYEWKASIAVNNSGNYSLGVKHNQSNSTALAQVLSGINKPSNVPFLDPFCVSSLTISCNSPITGAYITGDQANAFSNYLTQTVVNFDGPVYTLPAGQVRLAVGGEYLNELFKENNYSGTTAAIGTKIFTADGASNYATSWYAELYVPIVGKDNAMAGIQSLELTLANRYSTSPNGGTSDNPKVGVNYQPIDDLKIHSSWGTSFHAASIRDGSGLVNQAMSVGNNQTASQYTGITIPAGVNPTVLTFVEVTGGQPGVSPETAVNWSLGATWTPSFLDGFNVDANYYNTHIRNQIAQAPRDAGNNVVNAGYYDQYLIYNPTYFGARAIVSQAVLKKNPALALGAPLTQAQYDAIINGIMTNPIYTATFTTPTGPIVGFCDCRRSNSGVIHMDGFDVTTRYDWDMGWATANFGLTVGYVSHYDAQLTPQASEINLDNSLTYPLRLTGRLRAGLDWQGLETTIFVNYKNPYRADPALLQAGAPAQYQHINGWMPVDVTLSYGLDDSISPLLDSTRITVSATNVFNDGPPFVLAGGNVNYDSTAADTIGRRLSLTLDKKF